MTPDRGQHQTDKRSSFPCVCGRCVHAAPLIHTTIPPASHILAMIIVGFLAKIDQDKSVGSLNPYGPKRLPKRGVPGRAISRRPKCASVRSPHTPCCPRAVLALYWVHTETVGSHHIPFKFSAIELRSALCTSSWDAVSSFDPRRSSHVGAPVRSAVIAVARY